MNIARSIHVKGIVQGVGFRPFVFRQAQANGLNGWVANTEEGVDIFLEGSEDRLEAFIQQLDSGHPPAACITSVEVRSAERVGFERFSILESLRKDRITARISPDLAVCDDCLGELFDPADHRYRYPYINCTNCGPRYSILRQLPYDRPNTTMQAWSMDEFCGREYHDVSNRRFHAQPIACPACGPSYFLEIGDAVREISDASIQNAAGLLRQGKIVAVKGLGGYHLACDAANSVAVKSLRERKYRKEKPFAIMTKDLEHARLIVDLTAESEELLCSSARPIVLATAKAPSSEIAPDNSELGVMLPYTPLHHLLFASGAPDVLVMTSGNRSSEPIAYEDDEARRTLNGIADALLIGERPIARRVDDSVVRAGAFGRVVLRSARGLSPSAVAKLPTRRPILAVGADLKNTITLVVDGQAFVSQHIGDLEHHESLLAFEQTIQDLLSTYGIRLEDALVVHDSHPQYASTAFVQSRVSNAVAVQHHRAHIASVLAERECFTQRVLGVAFDGTGFGDDGAIWGGEIFCGSLTEGFNRLAHLRPAWLPGGDAAAHYPVQSAAGFLNQMEGLPNLIEPPFDFPILYARATQMVNKRVRTFASSSMGRLFDAAAALLGFTRQSTFEGQAAAWLEFRARGVASAEPYPFPSQGRELDFRPLLRAIIDDRLRHRDLGEIARAFHAGIACCLCDAIKNWCASEHVDAVVLSGGVFQNELLLSDLKHLLDSEPLQVWTNHAVPPNDGGISLGQAALATFQNTGALAISQQPLRSEA
ncbi:MAG: carbamoyltransferase HypF [Candidatus Acidiferrales bacterium]